MHTQTKGWLQRGKKMISSIHNTTCVQAFSCMHETVCRGNVEFILKKRKIFPFLLHQAEKLDVHVCIEKCICCFKAEQNRQHNTRMHKLICTLWRHRNKLFLIQKKKFISLYLRANLLHFGCFCGIAVVTCALRLFWIARCVSSWNLIKRDALRASEARANNYLRSDRGFPASQSLRQKT